MIRDEAFRTFPDAGPCKLHTVLGTNPSTRVFSFRKHRLNSFVKQSFSLITENQCRFRCATPQCGGRLGSRMLSQAYGIHRYSVMLIGAVVKLISLNAALLVTYSVQWKHTYIGHVYIWIVTPNPRTVNGLLLLLRLRTAYWLQRVPCHFCQSNSELEKDAAALTLEEEQQDHHPDGGPMQSLFCWYKIMTTTPVPPFVEIV